MWKIFMISFGAIALVYAILAATTTIFYKNKSTEELSHYERNILYRRATIGDRIALFFGNLLLSFVAPAIYVTAGLITLVSWLLS